MKRWGVALLLLLVIAAALSWRSGDLAGRPLHNDEAINAFKARDLWARGDFRYDPHEYHGPVLYYLTLPAGWMARTFGGASELDERAMRSVAVAAGVALLLVTIFVADALGRAVALASAGFIAVSPVMVYYSRYYIHELLLVFFTALTLACLWRYSRNPGRGWAVAVGAGVALMYATKETFVFAAAAAWAAWLAARALTWRDALAPVEGTVPGVAGRHAFRALFQPAWEAVRRHGGWAGIAFAVVFVALFSSFFRHLQGPLDAFKTYWIWGERAGGASPHVHPWSFYFERLLWFRARNGPVWSEAFVLAWAVVGGAVALNRRGWCGRSRFVAVFVAAYTVALASIYAVIPYKTPWCLLGFYHGVLILAGYGVVWVWQRFRHVAARSVLLLLLLAGGAHLSWQSSRATGEFAADFRNPWVYGHTSADLWNLLEQIREVSVAHPDGRRMPMQVMVPESGYWPLPWYLRDFERVAWWDRVPDEPLAPLVVTASRLDARLEEKSGKAWRMVGLFELRSRVFVELNVESGLWKSFLETRAKARAAEAAN